MRILPLFLAVLVGCDEVAATSDASVAKAATIHDESPAQTGGLPSLEARVAALETALTEALAEGAEADARLAELEGATGPDLSGFASAAQVAELEDGLDDLAAELADLDAPAPAGAQIHFAEGTCSWDNGAGAPSAVLNVGQGQIGFQVLGANGNAWDEYSEVWAIHQDLDGTLEVICGSLGGEHKAWAAKWRATWWTAQ